MDYCRSCMQPIPFLENSIFYGMCPDCLEADKQDLTIEQIWELRLQNNFNDPCFGKDRTSQIVLSFCQIIAGVMCALTIISFPISLTFGYLYYGAYQIEKGNYLLLSILILLIIIGYIFQILWWLGLGYAFSRTRWVFQLVNNQKAILYKIRQMKDIHVVKEDSAGKLK